MKIESAKDLLVYQKAYALAVELFELSKEFPKEERYALTDQIRRSSRSVCAKLRDAWDKRHYPALFVSKLTDCDGENSETDTWLDFSMGCGYLTVERHKKLTDEGSFIGSMLGKMINNPGPFIIQTIK